MLAYSFHCQCQAYERLHETARIEPSYSVWVEALALRLLPYGLSVMRRSIGEALSNNAFNCTPGALYVIYAEPNAIAIAEVKFREIAVRMLFLAMLIDALHAALEDRIVTLDDVGVDDATHPFVSRMVDGLMHPIFVAKLVVGSQFVAQHESFFRDIGADQSG